MARKEVRIDLPVDDAPATLKLGSKIVLRNTALGADSPVQSDFPWAVIEAGLISTSAILKEANDADRAAQDKHYDCLRVLGTAPGQNLDRPKTLYTLTVNVRDVLLVKNQENPEALSAWGFNVVVGTEGGKRTVQVDIPVDSPEDFVTLCKDIDEKHTGLGGTSPLNGKVDMATFNTSTLQAAALFDEAEVQRGIKEAKHGEVMARLGYAEGQTSETPETAYNLITNVRDLLLVAYRANPEELTRWGYKVVVTETAAGDGGGTEEPPPPTP